MSDKQKLKSLREKIDSIDTNLLTLLIERVKVSAEVGEVKKNLKIEIYDRSRESEILNKLQGECEKQNMDYEYIETIWNIILNKSHDIQINGR